MKTSPPRPLFHCTYVHSSTIDAMQGWLCLLQNKGFSSLVYCSDGKGRLVGCWFIVLLTRGNYCLSAKREGEGVPTGLLLFTVLYCTVLYCFTASKMYSIKSGKNTDHKFEKVSFAVSDNVLSHLLGYSTAYKGAFVITST